MKHHFIGILLIRLPIQYYENPRPKSIKRVVPFLITRVCIMFKYTSPPISGKSLKVRVGNHESGSLWRRTWGSVPTIRCQSPCPTPSSGVLEKVTRFCGVASCFSLQSDRRKEPER